MHWPCCGRFLLLVDFLPFRFVLLSEGQVWKQQHCCEVVGERRCEGVEGVWRYNDVCGGLLDSCGVSRLLSICTWGGVRVSEYWDVRRAARASPRGPSVAARRASPWTGRGTGGFEVRVRLVWRLMRVQGVAIVWVW